ncbi:kelch-like protein 20 [Episyrphus balteatus]|uniref:kelch-like protein 20 n=1 Tax=Episyrphus balteatus TaxID=286459 RepID=UPI002484F718|nr:kelch-like protein 20 [Episyrphus balteatus]
MSTPPTPSTNEKLIFKDDHHATNISEKVLKFYKKEEFFDVDLKTNNDSIKIKAHKIVLTASSGYFLEIFRHSLTTSKTIEMKEIEGSSLKLIIDFMYSGSIELSIENIESILKSAVFLKMTNLINGCCDFLEKNLNSKNCLRWLKLSKELGISGLGDKFLKFFYTNLEKITKEREFLLLNENELKNLLFIKNVYNNLEELVFLSLLAWIEHDKEKRQHLLLELLSMVRYHLLTAEFIIENIKSVSTTLENCHLIHDWLRYHMLPKSRTIEEQKFTSALTAVTSEMKNEFNSNEKTETLKPTDKIGAVNLNSEMEIEIRIYNEDSKNWPVEKRRSAPFPKMMTHYSIIVIDEKIYVVGGLIDNESTKRVSRFDTKTFQWTDLPSMRDARCGSQLANVNGHLCVFGGFQKSNETNFVDTVEIFNISTQKWKVLQPLYKPNIKNRLTGHNGILYIFDFRYGYLQFYDISTDKWTSMEQPVDDDVQDFRLVGVDNFLYAIIIGPTYAVPLHNSYMQFKRTTVKRFDLSKNSWSEVAKLPNSSCLFKMATAIGNNIMFLKDNGSIVEYNLKTNEFNNLNTSGNYDYICSFKYLFLF